MFRERAENYLYLPKIGCDCEDDCLRDRWRYAGIRFVLHLEHVAVVFCRYPPTFVLERLVSCVKIALITKRVFIKTLFRSIYGSFMIKSCG